MPQNLSNEAYIAQLEQELSLLRTLINAMPDAIYAKDKDSNFLLVNDAQTRLLGGESQEDLIGKNDFDFFEEELARGYYEDEQALINSGQPLINHEERVRKADGSLIWFLTTKIPVRNDNGEVAGVVGIGRDITPLKRTQEQLQEKLNVIEQQRVLMMELSTPIIPIVEGVLVMPLVGSIDTARAQDILRTLLAGITQYRARVILLDITGVAIVDTGVAAHLNKTVQAAKLKGAQTIISGISDAVAETIVDLGINWDDVDTVRNLQTGLMVALHHVGMKLVKEKD